MQRLIVVLAGLAFLCACDHDQPITLPPQAGVAIQQKPDDVPGMKRTYDASISDEVRITIECRTSFYGFGSPEYLCNGTLTQKDGRHVWFEPDNPADKILERSILPAVKKRCDEILFLDTRWRKSEPKSFTDKAGHVWERAEGTRAPQEDK